MKLEELELFNAFSEDPFSNTLKIVRFTHDDGSYPCNHGLAYSLCNTESGYCYMCEHDNVISSISKLRIENNASKRGINFPIFWTAYGKDFAIEKVDISDVEPDQIKRFASFCSRSGLETLALEQFEKFGLSLLIIKHAGDKVGFAIYSSNIPEDDLDKRKIINLLEEEGWIPQNKDSWTDWFSKIFDWIEQITKAQSQYDDPDDIPEEEIIEIRDDLISGLFSTEMMLIDNLSDIAKWLYSYEPEQQKFDIVRSVIELELVCTEKELAGHGMLDNVLLTLQKEALHAAQIHGLTKAYIKLIPVDKPHQARYKIAGFRLTDKKYFWTKNLSRSPLT